MKKPAAAKAPGPVHKGGAGGGKQPGNAPGRGKAAHTKPAPKKPAHVPAKVKAARHAAAVKASKTRAANARKAKAHPRRALALDEGVACCSAEALAASLRLSGQRVSGEDVVTLYLHTTGDLDRGAHIAATLEAAAQFGLAGVRPVSFGPVDLDDPAAQILGLSLPGPHAVLDTGTAWITWGLAWPAWAFPDVVTEEAWEVTWPVIRKVSRSG
jgi:hypothetical protein